MTVPALSDATWVAGLLAFEALPFGGAVVDTEVAERFMAAVHHAGGTARTVPSSLTVDALTGAIDLAATLAVGKPVMTTGLLQGEARLMVRRAERLDTACTSVMAQALDQQTLMLIAVTDLADDDAVLSPKLAERLPFRIESDASPQWTKAAIAKAQTKMLHVIIAENWVQDLCNAAIAIGVSSPRAVLQAVNTAKAIAALQCLKTVDEASVALAARLVLAHRAQHVPTPPEQQEPEPEQAPPPDQAQATDTNTPQKPEDAEVVLEAVKAALPPHLLQMAADSFGKRGAGRNVKNASPRKTSGTRGRRIGHKRASSLAGLKLDILATLRNAAPWQVLRRSITQTDRMIVTRDDFRVARIKQRNEATAIFAVDASGSTAFQRLAEAKGAVETILAECYVRRDRVALVAFRSKSAEVLLPPTRSLERAKRALASLPGGGGTPLASGLDQACALALQVRRAGGNPIVIMLTDGRGNVTRGGEGNKVIALQEAEAAAKIFASEGFDAMVIDVSPEPQKSARTLAANMNARYLPMPRASASDIARPIASALQAVTA
jgi:magnesium chelatase subunit D